jgi:hypothetical protein
MCEKLFHREVTECRITQSLLAGGQWKILNPGRRRSLLPKEAVRRGVSNDEKICKTCDMFLDGSRDWHGVGTNATHNHTANVRVRSKRNCAEWDWRNHWRTVIQPAIWHCRIWRAAVTGHLFGNESDSKWRRS